MPEHDGIDKPNQPEIKIDPEATLDSATIQAGSEQDLGSIGRYRLLSKLGEGGMGQVWLAEQTEPVRRQVALKLIRAGRYDTSALQRFDLERRSLAIMEHPAIAKVFDADSTPEGQPYLVMEYVAGLPITKYCDQKRMTTRERLALFNRVCQGVQHAHQKAIIHRDLKPSNVLVLEVDGKPQPRIIDFGIAKPASQVGDETMVTGLGGLVGTPGYMSPEQADPSGQDVDTRTDVYSLGVILYELLSGTLPFDEKKWRNRPFDQVLRELREDDPPGPSTKLSTDAHFSVTAAEHRKTALRQLVNELRGDLDWITLKALDRDRARRYATPLDLAADLEHYLNNEPVSARPASRRYRLKKYVQRNRLAVAAGATLIALLIAFGVTELLQVRRITRERDRANRITNFMAGMFKVSDPSEARGNEVTAREILDKAAKQIQPGLAKDPEVQAQMQYTMAQTYANLGLYGRAHELAEAAVETRQRTLGENNPETLESRNQLGMILDREGKDTEAERVTRDALDRERRVLGVEDPKTLDALENLAVIQEKQGKFAEEEKLLRELWATKSRRYGRDDPQTIRTMSDLGSALAFEGRSEAAGALFTETVELERRVLGPDHPQILATMHNMANNLQQEGRYADAERVYREVLEIENRVLGANHPDTANTMTTLANAIVNLPGRNREAETLYRQSLATEVKVLGEEHPYSVRSMEGLANLLAAEGHSAEAENMQRKILAIRLKTLPPEHTDTLLSQYNLAAVLLKERRMDEAEKLFKDTLKAQIRTLGPENPDTLATQTEVARVLAAKGQTAEAEALARQTFSSQLQVLGPLSTDSQTTLHFLGMTLVREAKYGEAKKLFEETIEQIEKSPGADSSPVWYSYAAVAVAASDRQGALEHLRSAIDHGYKDLSGLREDDDFQPLHADPRFDALTQTGTARPPQ